MQIVVPTRKSRPVEFKDLWRVFKDSCRIKWAMRKPFPGRYPFASSISHCQIEPDDPLRFFVLDQEGGIHENGSRLREGTKLKKYFGARTIINPQIVDTGKNQMQMREGCMSFPDDKTKKLKRFEQLTLKYWTFFGSRTRRFYMYRAAICQHELDHMEVTNIYERWKHTK